MSEWTFVPSSLPGGRVLQHVGSVVVTPRLYGTGSVVVAHWLSCSLACEVFLGQESKLCVLQWQAESLPLSHQGSPPDSILYVLTNTFSPFTGYHHQSTSGQSLACWSINTSWSSWWCIRAFKASEHLNVVFQSRGECLWCDTLLKRWGTKLVLCGCCSVAKLCPTFCNPMDCGMLGLPVPHHLPEFTQIHVHWISDATQLSHSLSPSSPPALNLSQHQGLFQWVGSLHQVAKVLEVTRS